MNGEKVALGLSGGVDSSVAAALLISQGYDVTGVYLECYNEPGCRTDQDKRDALQVALKLGIRFESLDFRKEYKQQVIEYFYREYQAGRTPNPDIMCNREIKFGIFYDWALRLNSFAQGYNHEPYDFVATGHYARITNQQTNKLTNEFFLQMARDESKDQSYFLCEIPSKYLKHIIFPLGNMLKSEVRAKAKELSLLTADKPDSMGICFIGDIDVHKLLKDKLGEKIGDVVMRGRQASPLQMNVIGKHKGLWFYTTGQRGGFEIDPKMQKPDMGPLYVIGKNIDKNELVVGTRAETMTDKIRVRDIDARFQTPDTSQRLWVRIRNLGELVEVEKIEGNTVCLKENIFGVASGQTAVFYDETQVLVGSSIIV